MKLKQFFLFILIVLIAGLLYHFRSLPTGQLWDNYTVFYVPVETEDEIVINAFEENGIKNYISLNGQENPVQLEKGSMAELMFNLNFTTHDDTYLERRLNYFYDSEKNYRVYYIPNKYKERIEKTVKLLDKSNVSAGVDSSVAFPWILPVILTVVSFAVMFFVRKKSLFFFGMILPVFYVYCNPFYSAASAVIIEMIILINISNLWGKEGAGKKILKNPFIWIVLLVSIVSAFSSSMFTGLYYLAAFSAQLFVILIAVITRKHNNSRQTYVFLDIKPLKMIPVYAKKHNVIFPLLIIAVAGIFISYKYYSTNNIKSHFSKILLPGIAEEHDETFPLLNEYYDWNWTIVSYPYKSLNLEYDEEVKEIVLPRFIKEENSIKQIDEVFANDKKFQKTMYDNIDDLGYNNIEHIIKNQGSDFKCGFTTAKNYQISFFSVIMIIICFFILIIIYFSVIIKKDGKK